MPEVPAIHWGARGKERGPVIATTSDRAHRNALGIHDATHMVHRAVAVAQRTLSGTHRPPNGKTQMVQIPEQDEWSGGQIVSLDPYGAQVQEQWGDMIAAGYDIRPTVAVTQAHLRLPEVTSEVNMGIITKLRACMAGRKRLKPDGKILLCGKGGDICVTKAAIEPVWYLPGVAERLGVDESELRIAIHDQSGGEYDPIVEREDLKVFLPPIPETIVYIIGDLQRALKEGGPIDARVHDACHGSDVMGSDICTCRPYLVTAVKQGVRAAQEGGAGVVVYRQENEARGGGEVEKYEIYNGRKGGEDRPDDYMVVAKERLGTEDLRYHALMPDVFKWLGIKRIRNFMSMNRGKIDAIIGQGIVIDDCQEIPPELIPADAGPEMIGKAMSGRYAARPEWLRQVLEKVKKNGRKYGNT